MKSFAHFVVVQPDVHVHAADEQAAPHLLHLRGQTVVSLLAGALNLQRLRERVGGGGDDLEAVLAHHVRDAAAQAHELVPPLLHRAADARADLDLALHELGGDLFAEPLAARLHHVRRRLADEVARLGIDDEVLLLDAHGERQVRVR